MIREILGYANDESILDRNLAALGGRAAAPAADARNTAIKAVHTSAVDAAWPVFKNMRTNNIPIDAAMARVIATANATYETGMTIVDRTAPDALVSRLAGQAVLKTATAHAPIPGADSMGHLPTDKSLSAQKRPRGRPRKTVAKKH